MMFPLGSCVASRSTRGLCIQINVSWDALLLDIVGDGNSYLLRLRGQRVPDHAEHYNPGSLFLSKKNMVPARV